MKTILISIRPEWVEKILNLEKTIEIRKSVPNELPCRVIIYCTKSGNEIYYNSYFGCDEAHCVNQEPLNGKVVAEFMLKEVNETFYEQLCHNQELDLVCEKACLTHHQLWEYGTNNSIFLWCINDLKIYDKPKTLQDFGKEKAPQSWCYLK